MSVAPNRFAALGVPADLCAVLEQAGIVDPTPVQTAVIADALAGRDVGGRAPTGSGKTLAFGVPLVARLTPATRRRPTALVLVPTRELASQIALALRPLVRRRGHDLVAVYGGVGYGPQRRALDDGAELVVACPGRLEDLLASRLVALDDVDTIVVDEADRMADMGFLPAVRRILEQTARERQVLLFSATFDRAVSTLSAAVQRDPVMCEIGSAGPDLERARHLFWTLAPTDRAAATAEAIAAIGSTIVFCRTRHGADRLVKQLQRLGTTAAAIHGGRSQSQRDHALHAFARRHVSSLVATDVAARGVHLDGVAGVVHFDPPHDATAYIHRSGRTARAGASGVVLSLVDPKTAGAARRLQRVVGIDAAITPVRLTDLDAAVGDVSGQPVATTNRPRPEARRSRRPETHARTPQPRSRRERAGR
jgi:superfamily II DNA/RNA helicase